MKKTVAITLGICVLVLCGLLGFSITRSSADNTGFPQSGYVLSGDNGSYDKVDFNSGDSYKINRGGYVTLENTKVSDKSFVHYADGSVMSFSDGILLNLSDMSDNFVNNYYLTSGIVLTPSGDSYTAQTGSGTMTFGENIWKLSDNEYIIQSKDLTVHLSDTDEVKANGFVQVSVDSSEIVHVMTENNTWMTISEGFYIQTGNGVKVYPVSQLIDNDESRMSLAKFSVSTEDSIVLTELETRKQIVPELNIDAQDGQDGVSGDSGTAGTSGAAGAAGAAGTEGAAGKTGTSGVSGTNGRDGADGSAGENGSSGKSGSSGTNGASGTDGAKGAAGADAQLSSSANSAIPTMALTDWQVTAASLKGTISISDPGGFLTEMMGDVEKHPAKVSIINVKTGEQIPCYQAVSDNYDESSELDTVFSDMYMGSEFAYFTTMGDPLKPDTLYRLSVTAYYKDSATNSTYSREFITREFYTDSTGVLLSAAWADINELGVKASVLADYQKDVSSIEVILLTPAQNTGYTHTPGEPYTYYYKLDYTTKKAVLRNSFNEALPEFEINDITYAQELGFPKLSPDTNYIARVYVNSHLTQGSASVQYSALTNQQLALKTLKRTPIWDKSSAPTVSYNRVTGAFEVYRPAISDMDSGIVKYVYTAYKYDASTGTIGELLDTTKRTVLTTEGEPVNFYLESGENCEYVFAISMDFNDNEKTVTYELGESEPVKSYGSSLPKVYITDAFTDYNTWAGDIVVDMSDKESRFEVSPTTPLTLTLYADQINDGQHGPIVITNYDSTVASEAKDSSGNYFFTAICDNPAAPENSSNERRIHLTLKDLYRNTQYTLTLQGYVDLNDGNGPMLRTVGTVSFRTYTTIGLQAVWSTLPEGEESTSSISRYLRIISQDSTVSDERKEYAMGELMKGQVTVQLLSGTGAGATLISTTYVNSADDLEAIYSEKGLLLTEGNFGSPALSSSAEYTLRITEVVDNTYAMSLGYSNTFGTPIRSTEIITAIAKPPDLLTNPATGIIVTPIVNLNASTYGGKYDSSYPDDTVVGYTLRSTYDNSSRLGITITYYAMEYKTYFSALYGGSDPLKDPQVPKLMTMTQQINADSDTVPYVAVMFGNGEQQSSNSDAALRKMDGYCVYNSAEPVLSGSTLQSGMGRGYRYVFAYTVSYSNTAGSDHEAGIYPYDHSNFTSFMNTYGCGLENGNVLGQHVTYILNSGMCEAPLTEPTFHTYVYKTEPRGTIANENATAYGNMTIHYTWTDPDDTIAAKSVNGKPVTQITWTSINGGTATRDISGSFLETRGGYDWYSVTVDYSATKNIDSSSINRGMVSPNVGLSRYRIDYSTVLASLLLDNNDSDFSLCECPVDWAWDQYFTEKLQSRYYIKLEPHYDENYILYVLQGTGLSNITKRTFMMQLDISCPDDSSVPSRTFYLPLVTTDASAALCGKLPTGYLGTEYVGRRYQTRATLIYDTGWQGTLFSEGENAEFGVQLINSVSNKDAFVLGSYFMYGNNTNVSPVGGLIVNNSDSYKLSADLRENLANGKKTSPSVFTFKNSTRSTSHFSRFIYPARYGLDINGTNSISYLDGLYGTVKKAGRYELTFTGSDTDRLSSIVPTINTTGVTTGAKTVSLPNFSVVGLDSNYLIDGSYHVYVAIYLDKEHAESLNPVTQIPGTAKDFLLDADGKVIYNENTPNKIDLPSSETTYYLVYYTYNSTSRENVVLLNSEAKKAVVSFTTTEGVIISSQLEEVQYLNESYTDKQWKFDFRLSRYLGVSLEYDIYRTLADAQDADATPLVSNQQLNDMGVINAHTPYSSVDVSIDLAPRAKVTDSGGVITYEPNPLRELLTPGATYYLKISAFESSSGGAKTCTGSNIYPAKIDPIGNYGALIYPQDTAMYNEEDSDRNYVEFLLTMSDPQYSFMSAGNGSSVYGSGAGLYMVRFSYTDENGSEILLKTTYDDILYPVLAGDALKKEFKLSNSVLKLHGTVAGQEIAPNRNYTMYVYTIVDNNHDGLSARVSATEGGKGYQYFFSSLEQLSDNYKKSQVICDLIDSFWTTPGGTSYQHNDSLSEIESGFLVATRSVKASDTLLPLVNIDKATYSRAGMNISLLFSESFDLIHDGNQQFRKIVYDVNGFNSNTSAVVHLSGTALSSSGDELITVNSATGYDIYSYTIPERVPTPGSYTITIQLYLNETDEAPYATISKYYTG